MPIPTALVLAAAAITSVGAGPIESHFLAEPIQLTFPDRFAKAGEAYFSPDGSRIIFQAMERRAEGQDPDPFYGMYTARLVMENGRPTGLTEITRISPPGSANTCGWFHPSDPDTAIFGSTRVRPSDDEKPGFQVGSRRYVWMFPEEMEIVATNLAAANPGESAQPIFTRPNYDAECSYSPDGRFILYSHIEDREPGAPPDANIYIYDTQTQQHHAIVVAPGYDGGPFFSPDGKAICYRSDRAGNDKLQLYVATLRFENGVPVGMDTEYQLTNNDHVNWAPYWHPTGKFLVYASSEAGHDNYEVFAIGSDIAELVKGVDDAPRFHARITDAPGADLLPAFSPDGRWMMWTSQRGAKLPNEQRPSSQLWIAGWKIGDEPCREAWPIPAEDGAAGH